MSEKRFVSFWGYAVEDKATAKKYSSDNIEELVDLINKLHDCYIKQGKLIFKLEEDLQYYKTKSARLEEELLSTRCWRFYANMFYILDSQMRSWEFGDK